MTRAPLLLATPRAHGRVLTVAALPAVLLLSAGALAPRGTTGATVGAETFFGCEQGYAFEVNGQAARCRRAASVMAVPALECPRSGSTTLAERVDYSGASDSCVGASGAATVTIERSCPVDYTKRVVVGPDRCERPTPESIRAPSVPVAR